MDNLLEKFAITIYRLRVNDKLSQREVALDADISLRHYVDLEKGRKNPTLKVVASIAKVYDLKTCELLQMVEDN